MSHSLDTRPESLKIGQPVFLLGYHDQAMRLPFVEAYVYIGEELRDGTQPSVWCFQSAESYLKSPIVDVEQSSPDADVLCLDRQGLATMVDWIGLVGELAAQLAKERGR